MRKFRPFRKAPAPKVVTQLGLINYYSKVSFKLSNTLAPLQKKAKWYWGQ